MMNYKKLLAMSMFAFSTSTYFAQDTIPSLTIDSTLTVGDSVLFHSNLEVAGRTTFNGATTMREDATAARDFTVEENTLLKGNLTTLGTIYYPNAPHSAAHGIDNIVTRDPVSGAITVYAFADMAHELYQLSCAPLNENPFWRSSPGKLFPACPDTYVGIGNTDPQKQLHVSGESLFDGPSEFTATASIDDALSIGVEPSTFSRFKIKNPAGACALEINQVGNPLVWNKLMLLQYDNPSTEVFKIMNTNYSANPMFFLEGNGRLTIHNGTQKIFQLNPDGVLRTRTVMVDAYNWPDYVFAPAYDLRPLSDVKAFITTNGHLPEVPSASQTTTEGVDVGEMNKILLKKIEELTLYMIQQEERIKVLESAIK